MQVPDIGHVMTSSRHKQPLLRIKLSEVNITSVLVFYVRHLEINANLRVMVQRQDFWLGHRCQFALAIRSVPSASDSAQPLYFDSLRGQPAFKAHHLPVSSAAHSLPCIRLPCRCKTDGTRFDPRHQQPTNSATCHEPYSWVVADSYLPESC